MNSTMMKSLLRALAWSNEFVNSRAASPRFQAEQQWPGFFVFFLSNSVEMGVFCRRDVGQGRCCINAKSGFMEQSCEALTPRWSCNAGWCTQSAGGDECGRAQVTATQKLINS